MIYFQNITNLEQAKLQYRKLAKQLHPDKGGSPTQFNQMQEEYKALLILLQNQQQISLRPNNKESNEIITELGKLAKVLIKKQLPQQLLRQRINQAKSPIEKSLYSGIIKFLDEL
jgi:hypothetical protein